MIAMRSTLLALGLLALPTLAEAAAPIRRVVSPGGIEAWLVEERTLPMVALEISFGGGAVIDPDDQAGAARFLAAMLGEGAGDFDSVAFAEAQQTTGMRLRFDAGREALTVSAAMLEETLPDGLALLRVALTRPRFDEEALRRTRAQLVSSLRSDEANPRSLASAAWFAAAFPDDPYGRPVNGRIETVEAMTADALRDAHARHITLRDLNIGVVGAIDAETLGEVLDTLLAGLPAGEPVDLPPVEPAIAGGVTVVPFPAPQSTVLFGHAGPLRDDDDFMAAFVLNHIIGGGGFSSILMQEVRERRGLAYGAYAYLAPLNRAGLMLGGVGTANERVAESIDVIRAEWRRIAENGVSEEQLDRAKRFLTGAYPLRFDSNRAIAGILVGMQRDGMPIDYPEIRNDLVEAVTVEDIQRVAARWLDADGLHFVVVGEPEGLPVGQ